MHNEYEKIKNDIFRDKYKQFDIIEGYNEDLKWIKELIAYIGEFK